MPKHQLLYRYFGWDMPEHAHLPLLRNPDRSKLSKRRHPASLHYFRDVGYLPEALLNYLGLIGWSMPDEREVFSVEEMIAEFDLDRVSRGGPIFDLEKLNWLNGQYIRNLSPAEFADRVGQWALNRDRLEPLVPLIQSPHGAFYRHRTRGRLPVGRTPSPVGGSVPAQDVVGGRLQACPAPCAGDDDDGAHVGKRRTDAGVQGAGRGDGYQAARFPVPAVRCGLRSRGGATVVRLHGFPRT